MSNSDGGAPVRDVPPVRAPVRPTLTLPRDWHLIVLPLVHSTQDVARDALRRGEGGGVGPNGGLVVWAGAQSSGRGRHGRVWDSPSGNLYVTVAVPCPGGLARATDIGFATGVALAEALADLGFGQRPGLPAPRLKWPNDVLLDGAKVAGLLLESAADPQGMTWVLVGMGVNVVDAPDPQATLYPTTALCHHWRAPIATEILGDRGGDPALEPAIVLEAVLGRLAARVGQWRRDGFDPIRVAWLRHGHGVAEPVRVRAGDQSITGVFVGLATDGALVLNDSEGVNHTVRAGDVFFPPLAGGARSDRA